MTELSPPQPPCPDRPPPPHVSLVLVCMCLYVSVNVDGEEMPRQGNTKERANEVFPRSSMTELCSPPPQPPKRVRSSQRSSMTGTIPPHPTCPDPPNTVNYDVFTTRRQENAANTKDSGRRKNQELQTRHFECRKRCKDECKRHVGFARLRHVGANNIHSHPAGECLAMVKLSSSLCE